MNQPANDITNQVINEADYTVLSETESFLVR
jgi:hypothetical protein